ncbi:MAG: hypothetical protein ACRDY5_05515, partial [Acidimicrobiales bacterium]
MTGARVLAAVGVFTAALGSTPARAAAVDSTVVVQAESNALVRVAAVAPGLAGGPQPLALDGQHLGQLSFGQATGFRRTSSGEHELAVGTTVLSASLEPGCLHTLLLVQPKGVDSTVELLDAKECSRSRTAPGAASVRFIHATTDSAPASLALGTTRTEVLVPFTAATRVEVPSGPTRAEVLSGATGERLGAANIVLPVDGAVTAVWAGGAEVNLALVTFSDGAQPHRQPEGPINTGLPDTGGRDERASALALAALGAALLAFAGRAVRRRRLPWLATLGAVFTLVGLSGCQAVARDQPVGAPPAGRSPTSLVEPSSPTATEPVEAVGQPASLEITGIGVAAPVQSWSLDDLPDILDLPGPSVAWFSETSLPGALGVAVVVGHGPAGGRGVLGRLDDLTVGAEVVVVDAAGHRHS